MANEEKNEEKNEETGGTAEALPAGFTRVNPEAGPRNYFKPVEGLIVQGILLGRFKRKDNDKYFYQIRLTQPCDAQDGNQKSVECQPGDTLTVDERTALEDLAPWTEKDHLVEVFIRVGKKEKLSGGRTFWPMDVGAKPVDKIALRMAGMDRSKPDTSDDGEEVPF